jgi:hypothetical protein
MYNISIKQVSSYLKDLKILESKLWEPHYPDRDEYCRKDLVYTCEYSGFDEYIYPPDVKDCVKWVKKYEHWLYICGQVDWIEKKQGEMLKLISKDKAMCRHVRYNYNYYNDAFFILMLESSILNITEKTKEKDVFEDGVITIIKEYAGLIFKCDN